MHLFGKVRLNQKKIIFRLKVVRKITAGGLYATHSLCKIHVYLNSLYQGSFRLKRDASDSQSSPTGFFQS